MRKTFSVLFLMALCSTSVYAASKKAPAKDKEPAAEKSKSADGSDSEARTSGAKGARSGRAGAFGLGVDLQASLVGRYWISDKLAFDAAFGFGDMNFTPSFYWVPEVRAGIAVSLANIPVGIGTMPFYLGGGAGFHPCIGGSNFSWAVDVYGVAGFNFIPAKAPIDVFAEVRPTLGISDLTWVGGIPLAPGDSVGWRFVPTAGLRYYF